MTCRTRLDRKLIADDVPDSLRARISTGLIIALRAEQKCLKGEKLEGFARRVCPQVFMIAEDEGFVLDLSHRRNTHKALIQGKLTVAIRRRPLN